MTPRAAGRTGSVFATMLVVAACSLGLPACDRPQEPECARLNENWQATVLINFEDGHATGVIVSHEGHVLTNGHVVRGNRIQSMRVRIHGGEAGTREFTPTLVAVDEAHDLALLRIPTCTPHSAIINPIAFPGDDAYIIGFPENFGQTISRGELRHLRFAEGSDFRPENMQDSILFGGHTEHGSSGGGLFLVGNGQLVGLNVGAFLSGPHMFDTQREPLCISARHIVPFLEANNVPYCRPEPSLWERIESVLPF